MNRTKTQPKEAARERAALISGASADLKPEVPGRVAQEFIRHQSAHLGTRLIRVSTIEQVIYNKGEIGGPWFIRVGGQQLRVDEQEARRLVPMLTGMPSEEVFP